MDSEYPGASIDVAVGDNTRRGKTRPHSLSGPHTGPASRPCTLPTPTTKMRTSRYSVYSQFYQYRLPRSQAKPRRAKRRKTNKAAAAGNRITRASTSLSALLDVFQHGPTIRTARETDTDNENQSESDGFEATMEGLLPECLEARQGLWAQSSDIALPVRFIH